MKTILIGFVLVSELIDIDKTNSPWVYRNYMHVMLLQVERIASAKHSLPSIWSIIPHGMGVYNDSPIVWQLSKGRLFP